MWSCCLQHSEYCQPVVILSAMSLNDALFDQSRAPQSKHDVKRIQYNHQQNKYNAVFIPWHSDCLLTMDAVIMSMR